MASVVISPDRDHDAGRSLRRAATHLVTNAGLTSGLGLAYWLVAARLLTPKQVGRGSALVALILTLSTFSQMNFNVALSRILPRSGDGAVRVVAKIYAATATVSVVVGAAFLVAAPGAFRYLSAVPAAPLLLGLATAVWTIFALEDNVLATVRRTRVIPIENATFGAAKLIMLGALVAAGVTRYSIVVSSIAPLLAIVLVVNLYLFVVVLPGNELHVEPTAELDVSSSRFVWYDYAGSIAWLAGTIALPVIVASLVGPAREATFYVPYTVAIAVDTVTINLGNALTAEAIRARARGDEQASIAHFLRLLGAALSLCVIVGIAVSPFLLEAYGAHYRQTGTWTMRIILLAVLPRAALFLGLAIARSTGRGSTIVAAQFVTTIVTLGAGVPLVHALGIAGMAIAWLVGSSCGAMLVTVKATIAYIRPGPRADGTLRVRAVASTVSFPSVNAVFRFRVPAIAALVALAVVFLTPAGPGRDVAALYLSFAAPGLALAPVFGFRGETWWLLTGVIAISFAVDVIVAQAVLYTVGFHWRPCAVALVCITCLGSLFNPRSSGVVQRLAPPGAGKEEAAVSRD